MSITFISRRAVVITALSLSAFVAALLAFYTMAGFFDRDPLRFFAAKTAEPPELVAVLFSGDMGLHVGMGPHIADALVRKGIPVLGLSSSTEFATRQTRAQVDALVAQSIRDALRRTGAERAIVVGQSFGADVARVGLVSLPPDLRQRVVAAVLIVPGTEAFFHADPTGLTYRGRPDDGPGDAKSLDWTPIICIRGAGEQDSLCPLLTGRRNVVSIVLPGAHRLNDDHDLLTRTILTALQPIVDAQRIIS